MSKTSETVLARRRRHERVRARVQGTPERPRLCVFRSLRHIYVQVIDDTRGHTLLAVSTLDPEVQTEASAASAASEAKAAAAQPEAGRGKKKQDKSSEASTASTTSAVNGKAKTQLAVAVGHVLARRALAAGIKSVVFDRGGYMYHGRVRALAEAARKGGLDF